MDIIRELNSSLDLEAGGQLAETLRNLYAFFERRLIESNLKKSRKGIDEVIPMLKQLRDAWFDMLNGQAAATTTLTGAAENWPASQFKRPHECRKRTAPAPTANGTGWPRPKPRPSRPATGICCPTAISPSRIFKPHIAELTREARAEWQRTGCNLAEKEQNLQVFVAELIELTRQNQSLLQSTLRAARKQLDELGEAGKNLKLLQRSYGFVPTAWSRAA